MTVKHYVLSFEAAKACLEMCLTQGYRCHDDACIEEINACLKQFIDTVLRVNSTHSEMVAVILAELINSGNSTDTAHDVCDRLIALVMNDIYKWVDDPQAITRIGVTKVLFEGSFVIEVHYEGW
jgi:hypothetical protein